MKRLLVMTEAAFLMFLLYIIQFLVFPSLFPNYFRVSNEAVALYWISFALVVLIGNMKGVSDIAAWFPGDALYLICVKIYSANGAYNVRLDEHYQLKWLLLSIGIYAAELILFQLLLIVSARLLHKAVQRFKQ